MKLTIHQPRPKTHLPTHEAAARRHRAKAALPKLPRRTRPTPPSAGGRKTLDTRWPAS